MHFRRLSVAYCHGPALHMRGWRDPSTEGQLGKHMATADLRDVEHTLIVLWALQFPHAIALTATRCSIAILFLRVFFTPLYPKLRYIAYIGIASAVAWLVLMVCINLTHCIPIAYNWRLPLESSPQCFTYKPYSIFQAGCGLVLDGGIWLLAHFVVWDLQLRNAHKIAITVIFAFGLLNVIIAVFRISSVAALDYHGDILYDAVPAVIWAVAELSTAIALACCPLLRPLFEKMVPRRLTHIASGRYRTKNDASSIRVTTRIQVHPHSSRPRSPSGMRDSQALDFVVECQPKQQDLGSEPRRLHQDG
ncbi:hypothetical protein K491DRAFT_194432 [Lophiostoma macrostomum CBS 122681]|uniref:Rhodopsin domain-containing protein n=1 Tax=Lophiostoma macrostomum CBS 122681 TaxID=1314788 RepID=A0A6A6TH94_9PLEO|nr:hypothetical protein K491DRAFT_194432 [Lophiostoma macrostomum CBS 122681]